ncbi:pre-mRNA-splicing factor ATP-dependent RNA helicase DHX16-like [Cryptotermes secundus]|uniref:pre-mRNA-splicing factor ATP-dependent RNA helicase DHX16-like n=1 Tax=Cryptotermes secundus TaxID=105785 RepID=UPI000CD7B2FB|nr:pre-mRNA-splicing factor ATP-dependent RNA helicase DHX16-like [Cryptotermes secundus]
MSTVPGKRLKLESEGRLKITQQLRIKSRRKYLVKREKDKRAELEADIIDDEYLFQEEELTERERKEREHKKKLLQLAKEHEQARKLEKHPVALTFVQDMFAVSIL